MSKYIIYSKPNCQQCDYTKKMLDDRILANDLEKGIYEPIDVTEDAAGLEHLQSLGLMSLPVVFNKETETVEAVGFRPDVLKVLT